MAVSGEVGRQQTHDLFLSYAGEDRAVAQELANSLRSMGLNVWWDRFELRPGDRILDRVNAGLANSSYGVLLLSPAFLSKPWPQYETDILVREFIEGRRRVLPVWHGVTKEMLEERQPGLAGIWAITTDEGVPQVARQLAAEMVEAAGTIATIPGYSDPVFRFLAGRGELAVSEGGAFTLWEALVHFTDENYPIWLSGRLYEREDLLVQAWENLSASIDIARSTVGEDGIKKIRAMLGERGLDPDLF